MVPRNGQAFFDRWVPITACFLVFVFFGCGKDANELYWSFLRFLGLDRCFACLDPEYSRRTSMAGSTGSRVKLLFNKNKRWSSASRYVSVSASTPKPTSLTTCRTYVDTHPTNPTANKTYHDIEKGIPSARIDDDRHSERSWFRSFFHRPASSSSSDRERHPSNPSLTIPSNTVCTNAWAGMSRSRGSSEFSPGPTKKEFIRVRREISQESVTQEVV